MYFNPTLKSFGYSPGDIIQHNFFLSLIFLICYTATSMATYVIHPLKIIKVRAWLSVPLTLMLPFLINYCTHPYHLFALQSLLMIFALASVPSEAVLIKAMPVLKRLTSTSLIYAGSRALIYIFTSFGLVYLTEAFGNMGILLIMLPITIGFLWGVKHFENLEKSNGNIP